MKRTFDTGLRPIKKTPDNANTNVGKMDKSCCSGMFCGVFVLRYGIFERCRELVEAGYDVRQPDKENVTLLHWAAINNRIDLVKYVSLVFILYTFSTLSWIFSSRY